MVTLTAPHTVAMALAMLLLLVAGAFRSVISGRPWLRLKDQLGIVGTIRSLEVTHGPNGFHPHLHVLVFVEGSLAGRLDGRGWGEFQLYFRTRWKNFITCTCQACGGRIKAGAGVCKCGGRGHPAPSDERGAWIEQCYSGEKAGEYICKTQGGKDPGLEMTRADLKKARDDHRMPFQILESAGAGDEADLKLWHVYEQAMFGHQAITWSKDLRAIVRAAAPDADEDWLVELTDEDLADVEVNGDAVARVDPEAMSHARGIPGFRVSILEAYEDSGLDGLVAAAESAGFEVTWGLWGTVPLIVPAAAGEDDTPLQLSSAWNVQADDG